MVQRELLYLGEIKASQKAAWRCSIEVLVDGQAKPQQLTLLAEGPLAPRPDAEVVQIRLRDVVLARPWQKAPCPDSDIECRGETTGPWHVECAIGPMWLARRRQASIAALPAHPARRPAAMDVAFRRDR